MCKITKARSHAFETEWDGRYIEGIGGNKRKRGDDGFIF